MSQGRGLAIGALALGLVGLFSLGGLGVGSILGLALAVIALFAGPRGGRDVAWAAVAANVFALLTLIPAGAALLTYRAAPYLFGAVRDDLLPEPAQDAFANLSVAVPPPPPPPPPPRTDPSLPEATAAPAARTERSPQAPIRPGTPPRKTRDVRPAYPPDALAARVQGQVILECTISAEGKVVEVKTLRGHPLLVEAAQAAVRQWEYAPSELNGVAVPVVMTVTVSFKLS